MGTIKNWNDREIDVTYTPSRVVALVNYEDNLLRAGRAEWPPSEILQKLYANNRLTRTYRTIRPQLVTRLGYYCDLQSIHSEDAITWSFFSPIAGLPSLKRAEMLNWILDRVSLPADNCACEVSLFRRIPHPERLNMGGPELDFQLIGDRTVVFGEAKWRSRVATGQGIDKNKSQVQLRHEFLRDYGPSVFGNRRFLVLQLLRESPASRAVTERETVTHASLTWSDLCEMEGHPHAEEFRRYYEWKTMHTQG